MGARGGFEFLSMIEADGMGCADTFSDAKQEKKVSLPPPPRIHFVPCEREVA